MVFSWTWCLSGDSSPSAWFLPCIGVAVLRGQPLPLAPWFGQFYGECLRPASPVFTTSPVLSSSLHCSQQKLVASRFPGYLNLFSFIAECLQRNPWEQLSLAHSRAEFWQVPEGKIPPNSIGMAPRELHWHLRATEGHLRATEVPSSHGLNIILRNETLPRSGCSLYLLSYILQSSLYFLHSSLINSILCYIKNDFY